MTMDKSLRVARGASHARSVLTRVERIARLKAADRWQEGGSPFGLPKVRVYKLAIKAKKKKKKEDEEGAEGAAATPAAAGKGASAGKGAGAAKGAAPAKGARQPARVPGARSSPCCDHDRRSDAREPGRSAVQRGADCGKVAGGLYRRWRTAELGRLHLGRPPVPAAPLGVCRGRRSARPPDLYLDAKGREADGEPVAGLTAANLAPYRRHRGRWGPISNDCWPPACGWPKNVGGRPPIPRVPRWQPARWPPARCGASTPKARSVSAWASPRSICPSSAGADPQPAALPLPLYGRGDFPLGHHRRRPHGRGRRPGSLRRDRTAQCWPANWSPVPSPANG